MFGELLYQRNRKPAGLPALRFATATDVLNMGFKKGEKIGTKQLEDDASMAGTR